MMKMKLRFSVSPDKIDMVVGNNNSIENIDNNSIENIDNNSIENIDNNSIENIDNNSIENIDNIYPILIVLASHCP